MNQLKTKTMKFLICFTFISCLYTVKSFAQICTEQSLNIHEIIFKTKELEFHLFYEDDTIKKVCTWNKSVFKRTYYEDKKTIITQIIEIQPREMIIPKELQLGTKKVLFYELCD